MLLILGVFIDERVSYGNARRYPRDNKPAPMRMATTDMATIRSRLVSRRGCMTSSCQLWSLAHALHREFDVSCYSTFKCSLIRGVYSPYTPQKLVTRLRSFWRSPTNHARGDG